MSGSGFGKAVPLMRRLLTALMILTGAAAIGGCIYLAISIANPAGVEDQIGRANPGIDTAGYAIRGALLCVIGVAIAGMVIGILRELRKMLGGRFMEEPFARANVERFSRMTKLSFAIALVSLPAPFLSAPGLHFAGLDVGLTVSWVFIGLSFSILSHVFRRGFEMREDLEGTV